MNCGIRFATLCNGITSTANGSGFTQMGFLFLSTISIFFLCEEKNTNKHKAHCIEFKSMTHRRNISLRHVSLIPFITDRVRDVYCLPQSFVCARVAIYFVRVNNMRRCTRHCISPYFNFNSRKRNAISHTVEVDKRVTNDMNRFVCAVRASMRIRVQMKVQQKKKKKEKTWTSTCIRTWMRTQVAHEPLVSVCANLDRVLTQIRTHICHRTTVDWKYVQLRSVN